MMMNEMHLIPEGDYRVLIEDYTMRISRYKQQRYAAVLLRITEGPEEGYHVFQSIASRISAEYLLYACGLFRAEPQDDIEAIVRKCLNLSCIAKITHREYEGRILYEANKFKEAAS